MCFPMLLKIRAAINAPFAAYLCDFIDATARVTAGESEIEACFQKRIDNPFLMAAGFDKERPSIPSLETNFTG